jgi:DNA-binding NtrC family response regulator
MAEQAQETTRLDGFHGSGIKVLLVDGDVSDLNYHATLFEEEGLIVSKRQLYETAMRSIERDKFDLVIVDAGSAAFEGRFVLRYINQYQAFTPCVVVARSTSMSSYLQAMELGAAEYLQKPLLAPDVRRIVRALTCHD